MQLVLVVVVRNHNRDWIKKVKLVSLEKSNSQAILKGFKASDGAYWFGLEEKLSVFFVLLIYKHFGDKQETS
jgi:hypothetical protein